MPHSNAKLLAVEHQLDQLKSSIASLRGGEYSDFQILCSDGTMIRVHRAIVCSRSSVLAAAFKGQFKEAQYREIFLEDDEPLIVAKMIDFLYCLDYDDMRQNETAPEEQSLLVNAKIYVIADKYNTRSLKEWAVTKYQEVLPATWNSACFIASARLIFDNTLESDLMLREIITRKAGDNAKTLFNRGDFVDLLKTHGNFAAEVMKAALFKEPEEKRWIFGTVKKEGEEKIKNH